MTKIEQHWWMQNGYCALRNYMCQCFGDKGSRSLLWIANCWYFICPIINMSYVLWLQNIDQCYHNLQIIISKCFTEILIVVHKSESDHVSIEDAMLFWIIRCHTIVLRNPRFYQNSIFLARTLAPFHIDTFLNVLEECDENLRCGSATRSRWRYKIVE